MIIKAKTTRRKGSQTESGQVIIIIALVMIGLLAILGLAIDGGGLLFLRRDTQNATDAAIVAAAYAKCINASDAQVAVAALAAAEANGFEDQPDGSGYPQVEVNIPPLDGLNAGDDDFVEIVITAEKPKYFIQLVFSPPLLVTNRAVGACNPAVSTSVYNSALYGTGSNCPGNSDAISVGGADTYIVGGVSANHNAQIQGANVTIEGEVSTAGEFGGNNVVDENGDPIVPDENVDVVETPLLFELDEFAPSSISDPPSGSSFAQLAYNDGDYFAYTFDGTFTNPTSGVVGQYNQHGFTFTTNGGKLGLNTPDLQGLIYVEGGDIDLGNNAEFGGDISLVTDSLIATGQSMSDQALRRYTTGGTNFPAMFTTYNGGPLADCNENAGLNLKGNSNAVYGLIYAPYANAQLSASNSIVIGGIIAASITVSGSDNTIIFDVDLLPPIPPNFLIDS